jgi:hypothetical protein
MRRCRGVASALFVCAACGKTHTLADAPTGDSNTADAASQIDATTSVTVTTYSRQGVHPSGTLEADIPVVTVQPNGSLGPVGMTGADGTVTLTGVEAGAGISAIYPVPNGAATDRVTVTMLGVKPGDHLVFGERFADTPGPADAGTLTIDFPAVTNATSYEAYWSCGSTSVQAPATSLGVGETCAMPTVNVLLLARDGTGTIIASGVVKHAPFTSSNTVTLAAWTPATANNFTVSATGLAAATNGASLGVDMVVDGAYELSSWGGATVAGNAASMMFQAPPGGDRIYAYAMLRQNGGTVGRKEAYAALAQDATTASFTEPALPWLGNATTIDAAKQTITWTEVGTGAYDAAVVRGSWSRTDAGTQVTTNYTWIVAGPPGGGNSLSWAGAPAALAPYLPGTTDTINGESVMLVDLSSATSFDQLRAAPEWQWSTPGRATARGELTGISTASFDGAEGNPPPIVRPPAR